MKFGLTDQQYKYISSTAVKPLMSKGASVWCYGSRARGEHKKYSDIDLMVECNSNLSKEISAIQEILQKSNFTLMVDLVQLSDFSNAYKDGYEKDKQAFDL